MELNRSALPYHSGLFLSLVLLNITVCWAAQIHSRAHIHVRELHEWGSNSNALFLSHTHTAQFAVVQSVDCKCRWCSDSNSNGANNNAYYHTFIIVYSVTVYLFICDIFNYNWFTLFFFLFSVYILFDLVFVLYIFCGPYICWIFQNIAFIFVNLLISNMFCEQNALMRNI